MPTPSAQFSLTLRVALPHRAAGALSRVTTAITRAGGAIVAVDAVETKGERTLREITVECSGVEHRGEVIRAVQAVRGAELVEITDRTFEVHRRGKIHTGLNMPVKTRDDLSMAYTPGVARVCTAISENRQKAFKYTIKANTVAVVSDGTAVLGLGDIGPEAAMPVMEGKAMLFKEFADVDAFPICLNTKDVDEIVETVIRMSPTFGGINLEDISSPRCFEIEQRLQEALDIPVFHDDQHGTAIVTLAALINACRLTDRRMEDLEVVMVGAGAAGVAVAKILIDAGVTSIVACDRYGAIHAGREDYHAGSMNAPKRWLAENTNPARRDGQPREVIEGTDLFVGAVGAGHHPGVRPRADEPGPVRVRDGEPESRGAARGGGAPRARHGHRPFGLPEPDQQRARVPGRVPRRPRRARHGDHRGDEARGRARNRPRDRRSTSSEEDYIVPSVFNRDVGQAVAGAVADVAARAGDVLVDPEEATMERAASADRVRTGRSGRLESARAKRPRSPPPLRARRVARPSSCRPSPA